MLSALCFYLVNICLIFSILYMLYRLLMAGRGPDSERGRGRSRKHGLPPHTHAPPTTSTALASITSTTTTIFALPSHYLYIQEFVMIFNLGYVELESQPSPLPPPPPLPGGEARISPVPSSTRSPIPN